MKFTGEAGQVEVTLARSKIIHEEGEGAKIGEGGETMILEFCVSDTGCGITDNFKKRLFEPFCQFFNSSRGGGTGLGLYLFEFIGTLLSEELIVCCRTCDIS